MQDFGSIIRFHREKGGLSQKELADYAGVGKTVVWDMEHNKPGVRLNTLMEVCKVLNISLHFDSPLMNEYRELKHEKG